MFRKSLATPVKYAALSLREFHRAGRPTRTERDRDQRSEVGGQRTKDVIASRKKAKINDTKHALVECVPVRSSDLRGKQESQKK